ncbi:unnamed protein product [Cuscuta europaea]|uniref:Serine/threonine-protein kinase 19 n=1 Tax=Cuscuta europaea TaxID=41803 RepID=A0A9P0YST1_CUSEU|nr:unnamed protein product [Cuscuta europaea]
MDETASTSRKRQRDPESGSSDLLEDSLALTDTFVAVRMMSAQFPCIEKVSIRPFVLQSQLYSSIKDRTQVDKELESLKREKMVRILKLNTGRDDHAIMLLEDYLSQCSLLSLGGKVEEEHVSLLINAGLLTRQPIDPNMYWFAIPSVGPVLKGLSQGRNELLSLLNRRKFKEMMMATLEKKRLRFSLLDMRFHLRDLIGSGHLTTVETPSGLIVRVSKD